jgi:CubicO group peptidase (beta-lactamase class C family)
MKNMRLLCTILSLASATLAAVGGRCPPTGPVLPPPKIPGTLNFSSLKAEIDALTKNPALPWNMSTTSFSVEITSPDETLFSQHHTALVRNETGVKEVDADSVYRVFSITKVFTTLALLLNAPEHLDSLVVQFIPELRGYKQYEEITLRMLASHLAGVPRDGKSESSGPVEGSISYSTGNAFDMFTINGDELQGAGFPEPDPEFIPRCDVVGEMPCTRTGTNSPFEHYSIVWLIRGRILRAPCSRAACLATCR